MRLSKTVRPAIGKVWLGGILLSCLFGASMSHGAQSLSLAWDPSLDTNVIGYYFCQGTTHANYSSKMDVGTNTVVTLTGLVEGQGYYFVVTAYNRARIESLPSNEAYFLVPTNPPPPSPLAPQLTAVSPAGASPGSQLYLYGANLGSATSVRIGGLSATFVVSSTNLLIATVPAVTGNVSLSITTSNGVAATLLTIVPVPAPANDNFANAQVLTGNAAVVTTNTTGATKQAGEPNHASNTGGNSVWFRWTAPAAGTYQLDTAGSAFTNLLAVYTGNTVTGLSLVASNRTSTGTLTTAATFNAVAGVTYQIALDGAGGAAGSAVLRLGPASITSTVFSTTFDATEGFLTGIPLAGQNGWLASGLASSGLRTLAFAGYGQQAYIGYGSGTPAGSNLFYRPLNYVPNTNSQPVIQFSVLMQFDNFLGLYNDLFAWVVRNTAGRELIRISFDNAGKTISHTLDNGGGPVPTGLTYDSAIIYPLVLTMDFGRNRWSASFNGATIASEQPITTTGAALTLGNIAAAETFRSASLPGLDGLIFDNYLVTAGPNLVPLILSGLQNKALAAGGDLALGIVASGSPPLSYQWRLNNVPLANATNTWLSLTNVATSQSGSYSIIVSNSNGSVTNSALVTITTLPPASVFARLASPGAGGAVLNLTVAPGYNYRLQASTNLATWTTLYSFYAQGTNAVCFDPAAASFSRRFYRLVTP